MTSLLHIRDARKDEVDHLVELSVNAFKGRPLSEALFPAHLQTDGKEEHEFRASRHRMKMDSEEMYYVVVADEEDKAVGCAVWQRPSKLSTKPVDGEPGATMDALRLAHPSGMDLATFAEVEKLLEVLLKSIRERLGEEGYQNSWCLDALAVDPAHQRKGIGKMLVQWGQDRADREHQNVHFMSSEAGSKLYRSMGYEEVGSLDIYGGIEYAFIKKAI